MNSTENNGHSAMYSVWNVRHTILKRLLLAILVHIGAVPNDYQLHVGNGGETVEIYLFLAFGHDRY